MPARKEILKPGDNWSTILRTSQEQKLQSEYFVKSAIHLSLATLAAVGSLTFSLVVLRRHKRRSTT